MKVPASCGEQAEHGVPVDERQPGYVLVSLAVAAAWSSSTGDDHRLAHLQRQVRPGQRRAYPPTVAPTCTSATGHCAVCASARVVRSP